MEPDTVEPMTPLMSMMRPIQATPAGEKPKGKKSRFIVFPSEKSKPIIDEKATVRTRRFLFMLISLRATKGLLISTVASEA